MADLTASDQQFVADYDEREYPPFAVTVDVCLLTVHAGRLSILLIERGGAPYEGCWALPGGFVEIGESAVVAAMRELEEETGVENLPAGFFLEQLKTYSEPSRDPRMRVVSVGHVALVPSIPEPKAGSDARSARLWDVADLGLGLFSHEDPSDAPALAFDHATIVRDAVERVRAKLEYSTVGTAFCPETFTISDLRRIYEAVWGAQLHQYNFRDKVVDKVEGFVVEAGGTAAPANGGRPARLYKSGDAVEVFPPFVRPVPGDNQSVSR